MLNIVESYIELKKNMATLINKSGYKNAYLAEQIGIPAPTFSVKKQRGNWTETEIQKILAIIENERLEDFFMLELMRSEKDEPRFPVSDLKKSLGW
ncbi:hypothetical protein [Dyadobacter frigoris]|uniref:Uncharacterized protein n=1 Tax=Dyadobacter frigoris TaxID=2576211 RepID=A0A4U6D9H6_9BACT|nr:hypothetical protein [Dyadobacter frigoris]TKT92937.1 hypothetical protein FDK13_09165 [Dyadobacter frigoris]GLU54277.1 hypothetical protein Dfri01_37380 [Dyadobacter frigoris]